MKNCIICKKPISNGRKPRRGKLKLRDIYPYVTCCHECSKVYVRVYNHIRGIDRLRGSHINKLKGGSK